MRMLLIAMAITCITACGALGFPGVYRIDVEQGNIVTWELADQLQPGMSKRQVRFILGTPLVEDSFNRNRWDYTYSKRNGLDVLAESDLIVIFDDDKLTEVRGDYIPTAFDRPEQAAEPAVDAAAENAGAIEAVDAALDAADAATDAAGL